MAISRVQAVKAANTGFAQSLTTGAFGSSTTSGNLIVVGLVVEAGLNNESGVTDSKNNTYIKVASVADSALYDLEIWVAYNITGGAGHTVTETHGAFANSTLIAEEWSGLATTSAFDQKSTGGPTASGTLDSGATPTTTQANELVWGFGMDESGTTTFTLGTGYTNLTQQANTFHSVGAESKVVSATGTYNATMSSSVTNQNWLMAVATFADTPAGGTTTSTSSSTSTSTSQSTSTSSTSSSISTSSTSTSQSTSTSSTSSSISTSSTSKSTSTSSTSTSFSTSSTSSSISTSSTSSSTSTSISTSTTLSLTTSTSSTSSSTSISSTSSSTSVSTSTSSTSSSTSTSNSTSSTSSSTSQSTSTSSTSTSRSTSTSSTSSSTSTSLSTSSTSSSTSTTLSITTSTSSTSSSTSSTTTLPTDPFKPEIKHKLITQNTTVLDGTVDALMEDTVYTMEDASAVMGGPTTPFPPINWTIVKPRIDGR